MLEFVRLLNKCCNLFAPFIASHKIEKEEQERKRSDLQIKIDFFFFFSNSSIEFFLLFKPSTWWVSWDACMFQINPPWQAKSILPLIKQLFNPELVLFFSEKEGGRGAAAPRGRRVWAIAAGGGETQTWGRGKVEERRRGEKTNWGGATPYRAAEVSDNAGIILHLKSD